MREGIKKKKKDQQQPGGGEDFDCAEVKPCKSFIVFKINSKETQVI